MRISDWSSDVCSSDLYIAAKHAVIGLTRIAAVDYGQQGIRVNAVLPGAIRTPTLMSVIENEPSHAEFLKTAHPIGRYGEPAEIGETAAWLLSDASSFVTGAAIAADGGGSVREVLQNRLRSEAVMAGW